MASRLVFEIVRKTNVTDSGLIDAIVKPAEQSGLCGLISRFGSARYYIVLEGNKDAILMFESVLVYVTTGMGQVGGIHCSHGHETHSFSGGVTVKDHANSVAQDT